MPIVTIVLVLLFAGFVCWLIQSAPMINGWFKNLIIGVVAFACLIYILNVAGILGGSIRLR